MFKVQIIAYRCVSIVVAWLMSSGGMAFGGKSFASAWQDWSWEERLASALMRIASNVNLDIV